MHSIHALFSQAFEYNLFLGSLVMFFLGLVMSFNPCKLGMATSVVGLTRTAPRRGVQVTLGLILTITFVLTLIVWGGILAYFGQSVLELAGLGEKFIGVVFVSLALYLLGVPLVRLTRYLRSPLKVFGFYTNGKWPEERVLYLRGAGLGAVFGIIPTPCTTPALMAIIAYITTKEEVLSGLVLLIAYGLGTGMIFILSGLLADKLSKLSSKGWGRHIDKFIGLVLLLVAVYFLTK
ncbi:MAG: cytochrome c biogenesis CcdA family protein [Thermincolia bacterium]